MAMGSKSKRADSAAARHWLMQKISALALLPLVVWFLVSMAMLTGATYQDLINWVKNPFVTVGLILFLGLVFFHLKLGVHEVVEDYVQNQTKKVTLLFLNSAFAYVFGLLSIISILRITLGS